MLLLLLLFVLLALWVFLFLVVVIVVSGVFVVVAAAVLLLLLLSPQLQVLLMQLQLLRHCQSLLRLELRSNRVFTRDLRAIASKNPYIFWLGSVRVIKKAFFVIYLSALGPTPDDIKLKFIVGKFLPGVRHISSKSFPLKY